MIFNYKIGPLKAVITRIIAWVFILKYINIYDYTLPPLTIYYNIFIYLSLNTWYSSSSKCLD